MSKSNKSNFTDFVPSSSDKYNSWKNKTRGLFINSQKRKMYCECTGIYKCCYAYNKPNMESDVMLKLPNNTFVTVFGETGNFYIGPV
jgi:hypothetical protein